MVIQRLSRGQFFRDGLPFEVHQGHYDWSYPEHTHDFHELVLFTGGAGTQSLDERVAAVVAGDVFVLRGDVSHGIQNAHGLEFYNLLFLPEELRRLADLRGMAGFQALFVVQPAYTASGVFRPHLRLETRTLAQVVQTLERLREEVVGRSPGRLALARALFQELLVVLSREYERRPPARAWRLDRLSEAVAWLERHYLEEVRLADLARRAHCTPRHFSREFRRICATSPIERVLQLRLDHAAGLLRDTALSITEVATRSGFNDSNYFARQFRRRFQRSPRAYRNRE